MLLGRFTITVLLAINASCSFATQLDKYDYIVVGGGTAGAAVATRLSQRLPRSTILLIEAGPASDGAESINIPGLRGTAVSTIYDWNFTSTPQSAANNRSWALPRGHVLGGSSALNYLAWTKASAAEYDAWESLGNPGWNWNTMKEHMMRAETFTPGEITDDFTYIATSDGTVGPVQTLIDRLTPKFEKYWFPTMANLGIETNSNPAGGRANGACQNPTSINPTTYGRSFSANAYLPGAGSNLELMLETQVAKLNLEADPTGSGLQKANGVTLMDGSTIQAECEVILSAGAFQSPGLLEVSGIGQKKVLEAAGVEQLIDLPGVGENLQDHLDFFISYQLKDEFPPGFDMLTSNATYQAEQLDLWRSGSLSQYDQSDKIYAFLNWKQVTPRKARLEFLAEEVIREQGDSPNVVDVTKLGYLMNDTVPQFEAELIDGYVGNKGYPKEGSSLYGKMFLSIYIQTMHMFSRGHVHISSANLSDSPTIQGNYLSNEYDLQSCVESLKFARKVAHTEPLASVWVAEYEPGHDVKTDADWLEYVKATAGSGDHPLGTCAMLPRNHGGVVDSNLIVYGTSNVRVVDASIIPVQPSAHIQTAVYGIAEMAADLITDDRD